MGPSFAASRFINADPDHVYPANSVWFPFYDIRVDSGSTMGFVPHGAASLFSGPRLRIPPPPTGRRSVLYVGRPESVLRRFVVNEPELLDATRAYLAPLGYTLEVMTDPRHWRADRYVFSRAVLMFGPHGGAFSNMIFLQPGTPVVEFLSKSNSTRYKPRNCYAGMAAGLGLPFWRYNPPVFGYRDPMVVEIDAVLAMLKRTGALSRLPPLD